MRSPLSLALFAALTAGCVWTSDGGFAPRKESGFHPAVESAAVFEGEPIVFNTQGQVTIVGVEGRETISVRPRFYAGAKNDADARAAFRDAHRQLSIDLVDGVWWIRCPGAEDDHGTAFASGTGCTEMQIEVPMGSIEQPLVINGSTFGGGMHVSNVVVEGLDLMASFGLVADVTPVDGAVLELVGDPDLDAGVCSTWLRVPEDTAFEEVELVSLTGRRQGPEDAYEDPDFWLEVDIRGFDDAPDIPRLTAEYTWSREADGPRVESARVVADIGKAILTTGAVPAADDISLCEHRELGGNL